MDRRQCAAADADAFRGADIHGGRRAAGAVALFGIIKKGAQRWINIGVVIQPSEIMKIAMPLMLAWWFQKRETHDSLAEFVVAGVAGAHPGRPDHQAAGPGHRAAGAGGGILRDLPGRIVMEGVHRPCTLGRRSLPLVWSMLHDYQRQRVMTLLDPTTDPLGKGFHIIQSMIAVGSGGIDGQGLAERHADAISSSFRNARPTSSSPCTRRSSA